MYLVINIFFEKYNNLKTFFCFTDQSNKILQKLQSYLCSKLRQPCFNFKPISFLYDSYSAPCGNIFFEETKKSILVVTETKKTSMPEEAPKK
ncbi:MAG: hypothetical protein H6Q68_1407 [Firmicutes bacterium]|nr:hypothetical protein [Bacillota bacterium]